MNPVRRSRPSEQTRRSGPLLHDRAGLKYIPNQYTPGWTTLASKFMLPSSDKPDVNLLRKGRRGDRLSRGQALRQRSGAESSCSVRQWEIWILNPGLYGRLSATDPLGGAGAGFWAIKWPLRTVHNFHRGANSIPGWPVPGEWTWSIAIHR
jgi:hypothetical protein